MALTTKIIFLTVACSIGLSACGHKGKLKTPSEIERAEQKKKNKGN